MLFAIYIAVIIARIFDIMVFFSLLAVLAVFGLVLLIVQIVLKEAKKYVDNNPVF
jgi:hypothetical protein